MIRTLLAFFPLGLWAAAVLTLGTLDLGTPMPRGTDKGAHFLVYAVGGGIAAWTAWKQRSPGAGYIGLLLVVVTGIADELHQISLPHRDSDVMDWLADAAGALFAFVVVGRLLKRD